MNRDQQSGLERPSIRGARSPRKFIQYPSQQEAFSFLESVLADPKGLGLLHGPDVAGKSELIEQIAQKMRERAAVAVVDGSRLRPTGFLNSLLTQFGYDLELTTVDELLNMVSVFGVQQARSREAPVLILEHFNHMLPSTLGVLCKLALLTVHKRFALRIILVGDRYFQRVIDSPRMLPIAMRLVGDFEMRPLTARESLVYLFDRMKANGVANPDSAFSADICDALYESTNGWPGNLDKVAELVAGMPEQFPVRLEDVEQVEPGHVFSAYELVPEDDSVPLLEDVVKLAPPQLLVSHRGELLQEVDLTAERTMLGRSLLCDVVLANQYVSGQHALLVRSDNAFILVDLKSRNGTFVNSRPVKSQVLRNDDIISLGDFRLKVVLPAGYRQTVNAKLDETDTSKMKTLEDARRAREARKVGMSKIGLKNSGHAGDIT